jgi:serine/threonine protein kinase
LFGLHHYSDTLHIIDFGLAKQYRDPQTHIHVKYQPRTSPIGTARYASIGAQSGSELSRRDDIESLAYILIYLLRGSLPWQDISGSQKKKMLQMKKTFPLDVICEGLPIEFQLLLKHARTLKFEERPNYLHLQSLMRTLLSQHNSEPSAVGKDVTRELMGNWWSKEGISDIHLQDRWYVCMQNLIFLSLTYIADHHAKNLTSHLCSANTHACIISNGLSLSHMYQTLTLPRHPIFVCILSISTFLIVY